jgi:hypothetical protein
MGRFSCVVCVVLTASAAAAAHVYVFYIIASNVKVCVVIMLWNDMAFCSARCKPNSIGE